MLGERYDGIVCSDRWAGYDYLDPTRRQLCWAHLLRDFTAHSAGMGEHAEFGSAGLVVAHDLFDRNLKKIRARSRFHFTARTAGDLLKFRLDRAGT